MFELRYARDGFSVEAAIRKGRKLPEWFLDEPEAGELDEWYLAAFWDLSTTRAVGFSLGPIPWNQIRDYAEFAGLDRENGFAFASIIRKLDAAYIAHIRGDQEGESERAARAAAAKAKLGGNRTKSMRGRPGM